LSQDNKETTYRGFIVDGIANVDTISEISRGLSFFTPEDRVGDTTVLSEKAAVALCQQWRLYGVKLQYLKIHMDYDYCSPSTRVAVALVAAEVRQRFQAP
jgi:hypothetical protein